MEFLIDSGAAILLNRIGGGHFGTGNMLHKKGYIYDCRDSHLILRYCSTDVSSAQQSLHDTRD